MWFVRVPQVCHPFDPQGRHPGGNLFVLPSVLHRQTEADRHGWPHRPFRTEVRQFPWREKSPRDAVILETTRAREPKVLAPLFIWFLPVAYFLSALRLASRSSSIF